MMREIGRGINMGFKECEHQFKHHRWNCTSRAQSMRKILQKGEPFNFFYSAAFSNNQLTSMTTNTIVSFLRRN